MLFLPAGFSCVSCLPPYFAFIACQHNKKIVLHLLPAGFFYIYCLPAHLLYVILNNFINFISIETTISFSSFIFRVLGILKFYFNKLYSSSSSDMIKSMAKIASVPVLEYWKNLNGKGKGKGKGKNSVKKQQEREKNEEKRMEKLKSLVKKIENRQKEKEKKEALKKKMKKRMEEKRRAKQRATKNFPLLTPPPLTPSPPRKKKGSLARNQTMKLTPTLTLLVILPAKTHHLAILPILLIQNILCLLLTSKLRN